jgi:hypothetical protein
MRSNIDILEVILLFTAAGGSWTCLEEVRIDATTGCQTHEDRSVRIGKEPRATFVPSVAKIEQIGRNPREVNIVSVLDKGNNLLREARR